MNLSRISFTWDAGDSPVSIRRPLRKLTLSLPVILSRPRCDMSASPTAFLIVQYSSVVLAYVKGILPGSSLGSRSSWWRVDLFDTFICDRLFLDYTSSLKSLAINADEEASTVQLIAMH